MSEKFPGNNQRVNLLFPLEIAICCWFILRQWHHPFSPSISLNSSVSLFLAFFFFFFWSSQNQTGTKSLQKIGTCDVQVSMILGQKNKKAAELPPSATPDSNPWRALRMRHRHSLFQGSCSSSGRVCTHFCVCFLQHRTLLTALLVLEMFREAAPAQLPACRGFKEN